MKEFNYQGQQFMPHMDIMERRHNALVDRRIRILAREGKSVSAAFAAAPKTPFVNNGINWN